MTPNSHVHPRLTVAVAALAECLPLRPRTLKLKVRHASAVQEPTHLHRDGPQARESELGRARLVHRQRRQQRDPHSDRAQYLEGQAHTPRQSGAGVIGTADGQAFIGKAEIISDTAVQ